MNKEIDKAKIAREVYCGELTEKKIGGKILDSIFKRAIGDIKGRGDKFPLWTSAGHFSVIVEGPFFPKCDDPDCEMCKEK